MTRARATASVGLLMLLPLGHSGSGLDETGVAYALGAGICWALYIVFGQMTAGAHPGQATALGMAIASMIVLPFGIAQTLGFTFARCDRRLFKTGRCARIP